MSQNDDKLAGYENEPDVREFLRLLETPKTEEALKAPSAFHREVMLKAARLSTKPGLFERWRTGEQRGGESRFLRLLDSLRSLVVHPAFAYTLVLLLGIPAVRSYYLTPAEPELQQQSKEKNFSLKELLEAPARSPHVTGQARVQKVAETFLRETYRAAYETREIGTLAGVWSMSREWRDYLRRLFATSRHLAVLIDVDSKAVEAKENGQVFVPFAQVVTVVDQEGQFSTKGPFFCVADLRLLNDPARWVIQDLKDDPQHNGQCRPKT